MVEPVTLATLLTSVTSVLTFVITSMGDVFEFFIANPMMLMFIGLAVVGRIIIWVSSLIRA